MAALNYNIPDSEVRCLLPVRWPAATFSSSERYTAIFTETNFEPFLRTSKITKDVWVQVCQDEATSLLRLDSNVRQVLAQTVERGQHHCMQDQKCIVFMTRKRHGTRDLRIPFKSNAKTGGGTVMLLLLITLDSCR